jgi:peptide deformylase
MIRDLVKSDDSILHRRIEPCGVNVDRHFISKTLIENMFHHEGCGLSANQIGMNIRAFVMIRDIEYNDVIVCFNPRIISSSDDCVWCEEGCLSFPDQFINVHRPDKITVKYEDEEGKDHKITLNGFAARVFQHEFDHLNGIDFTQRQ